MRSGESMWIVGLNVGLEGGCISGVGSVKWGDMAIYMGGGVGWISNGGLC